MDVTHSQLARPVQPEDGLALWDREAEGGTTAAGIPVLRPDANERLYMLFTVAMARVRTHFLNPLALRGYVRCAGNDCLLCRLGYQAEVRDLLPVYDPIGRAVVVLPISNNLRPGALRPQVAPVLRQLGQQGGRPLMIAIRRLDVGRYALGTHVLPDGADDGADVIKGFKEKLDAGQIDLASGYPALAPQELAAMPEFAAAMRARGITL